MSNNHYQQRVKTRIKAQRRRSFILTPQGLQKLHSAVRDAEIQVNFGFKYTIDALGAQTGLSPRTVTKVLKWETGVDKRTLDCFFRAFNLELNISDYSRLGTNFEWSKGSANPSREQNYHAEIDISTKLQVQVIEMLNQTLATILELKILVKQFQSQVGIDLYQSHIAFNEVVSVLEEYVNLFATWLTALSGITREAVRTTVDLPLPDDPGNILLSINYHVQALADRLEPYAKSLRDSIDKTAQLGLSTCDLSLEISQCNRQRLQFLDALQCNRVNS